MDELAYEITCEYCESELTLIVYNIDEKPSHCPMCGEAHDDDAWEIVESQ